MAVLGTVLSVSKIDNPVNTLYTALLSSPTPSDETLQTAAARHALDTADQELMVILLRRTDLFADVDALLAECELPRVRAAWLARPGRSADVVTAHVRGESRATVLAAVASHPATPITILETLAGDSRRSILEALLSNPSSPDTALVKAISQLGENPRSYRVASFIANRLEERSDLHERIAQRCGPLVAHQLLRSGSLLSAVALTRLCRLMVVEPLQRAAQSATSNPKSLQPTRWGTGNRVYNELLVAIDSIERLASQPHFTPSQLAGSSQSMVSITGALNGAGIRPPVTGPLCDLVMRASGGEQDAIDALVGHQRRRDLGTVATSEDHTTLVDAVKAAMTERHQVGLFQALLSNPRLRLEHLEIFSGERPFFRLSGEFHESGFFQLFLQCVVNVRDSIDEPLARRLGKYGALLCVRGGAAQTQPRLRQVLAALPTAEEHIYDVFVEACTGNIWLLDAVLGETEHLPEILTRLDATELTRVVHQRPDLAKQIAEMLTTELGGDHVTWETFATIARDSTLPVVQSAKAASRLTI